MSDDSDRLAGPRRNARGQFEKGSSGNQRGRPHKRRRLDVPAQLGRDALHLGRQVVSVPGPNGPRNVTKHELVVEATFRNAVAGKAGAQRLWLDLMKSGLKELVERHPALLLADAMRSIYEDPSSDPPPGVIQAVDEWIRRLKRT